MTRMVKVTRKKYRRIPGYVIICLVVGVVTLSPQMVTVWKTHQEIKLLEAQKQQLLVQNQRNREAVKNLKSDAMVEKLAREELGMIKPGEKVLVEVIPKDKGTQ